MTALLAAVGLFVATPARADAGSQDRAKDVLLDTPYVTQTDQLCGGAALAMVLRYWGARDVFAEDFAGLVDDRERGIRTTVLARAAAERGLQTVPTAESASLDDVRDQIRIGRPVIALVQVRPGLYHYVVVVGVTDALVVFHDPASAPYRVVSREEFESRWSAAARWRLVSVPRDVSPAPRAFAAVAHHTEPADRPTSPCQALVAASVARAHGGEIAAAEQGLRAATTLCPDNADGWMELAGLRFLAERYGEAGALATQALQVDPQAQHAWRVLGTTRFLGGDPVAALEAWNHLGEPTADGLAVEGAVRTPHPLVVRTAGIAPRALLTPALLERGTRRLRALPAVDDATIRYEPQTGGRAAVTAAIEERAPYPSGATGWAGVGLNAAFTREIPLRFYGLARQGEGAQVAFRFRQNRPRLRGELAAPLPAPLFGVIALDTMWERQAYGPSALGTSSIVREERRRTVVRWSDWATGWLRWELGLGSDRFDERRFLAVEADVGTRWARDRVAVHGAWRRWLAKAAGGFTSGEVSAAWRSNANGWGWTARSGVSAAANRAPLALWPVASSSSSRGALLRGHDFLDDGIIMTNVIGRRLTFGTVEYAHMLRRHALGTVGVAGFVDIARAWQGADADGAASRWQADVGAGLRVRAPALNGQIRLDVAYATRTRRTNLSAGYMLPWGL
ncbi:MAG: C39 family peptidase [Acidobacteria bacterium]|nr:C39 family peptidase [Acidobacteriota bacterium]